MRSVLMGAALLLGACTASGHEGEARATGSRSFDVGGFDRIALAGSYDVVVTVGAAVSVRAEGDARRLERLDIRVEDGQLRIGNRERRGWSWGGDHGRVTVHVTVPALAAAAVAGSGDMRIDQIEGAAFTAAVAGSGDLDIAALRVDQASFSIAGSGNVRAAGAAARSEISIVGSGDADLERLESRTAAVTVMGSGDARLRATESASVALMGSGDVAVTGGARCSVDKHGSGDVRCGWGDSHFRAPALTGSARLRKVTVPIPWRLQWGQLLFPASGQSHACAARESNCPRY